MNTTEDEIEEVTERVICLRCGHDNSEADARCASCKAPLGGFAASAPWEMGAAEPIAYPPATNPRTKPIVFWGVWLFFGPSAIIGLWVAGVFAINLKSSNTGEVFEATLFALFSLLYSLLSVWVLWIVTRRYLAKSSSSDPS